MSLVGIAPLILTAHKEFPPNTVAELIDFAKKNPGAVNFGSSGIGAAAHLTTELFKQTVGVDMMHVPYKGTAPATQGLMGGEIKILIDTPSSMMPHVRGGKITEPRPRPGLLVADKTGDGRGKQCPAENTQTIPPQRPHGPAPSPLTATSAGSRRNADIWPGRRAPRGYTIPASLMFDL